VRRRSSLASCRIGSHAGQTKRAILVTALFYI
jgi:hypothetical protein